MRKAANIFWLGIKELRSFLHDYVLLGLVIYAFSLAVIMQARSNSQELHNASIAIVDEDHSELSRRIAHAFLPPLFQAPQPIAERDVVPLMNKGKIHLRGRYPAELRTGCAGRTPAGDPGRRRRHRDGAGGSRVRLRAADHHHRDSGLSLPFGGRTAVAGQSRRADRVQPECHDGVVHQRDGRSSTMSPCWRSFSPEPPSSGSASTAPWTICWSCR